MYIAAGHTTVVAGRSAVLAVWFACTGQYPFAWCLSQSHDDAGIGCNMCRAVYQTRLKCEQAQGEH
jgi:hypothetical protein